MSKKNKAYNVYVSLKVGTTVSISAESFEEALKKDRELKVRDVVEFDGDFIDGEVSVNGVFEE